MLNQSYLGLTGSSRAWLVAKLQMSHPRITVLCKDRRSSEEFASDLQFFLRGCPLLHVSGWDTLPFEPVSPQTYLSAERIAALSALANAEASIAVVAVDAALQRLLPKQFVESLSFKLARGEICMRDTLLRTLDHCGFTRVSVVEEVGEIAVRGLVVDLFPSGHTEPVRLEFYGDTIESIRTFDCETQRSKEELNEVMVLPVREVMPFGPGSPFASDLPNAIEQIKQRALELETPPNEVAKVIDALTSGSLFPGVELISRLAAPSAASYFDYIPKDSLLVLNDQIGIEQALDGFWEILQEREARFAGEHYLIPSKESLYLTPDLFKERIARFRQCAIDHIELFREGSQAEIETTRIRSNTNTELSTRLKTKIGSGHALQPLAAFLKRWRAEDFAVAFVVGSAMRAERLRHFLLEINVDAPISSQSGLSWMENSQRMPVAILQGYLSSGVQLPDHKIILISENEIFAERSYRKSGGPKPNMKRLLGSLAQLKEKDFVVHVDYGIGVYKGLKHLTIEGEVGDFLQIDYADSRLYLPVQNIGKIQKFVAAEGQKPVIDKLASMRWSKTKLKVHESVVALAGDLIKLYATRSVVKGWRYEPYGAEDDRFADGFAFDETPDQLKAIKETIDGMAGEHPMDRLVCGDVGFGKTEVALRAAYKCIQHGKQVALLVPTTILVEQHKNTFVQRFRDYPVTVEAVSRFYPQKKNAETLERLTSGDVDIIIGTHRLLQKDVQFKDLGLVIVDEEHRFGVKQKERLKQMKKQVDVLTLTATPIPRTLHMSLLGIRDISVINTPPQDRRTIRTYVATYDDTIVRDAILRELQRGGQCFFLHNKVQSIDLMTSKLAQLVPEARFAFAHGQMSEQQLEKIMGAFLAHESDVLVSTTIIESGLDIPNANTILIERADTLGLAQLYQLRGRVGRSSRQAYAYLLVPKAQFLTEDAQKRLKVLQSLDDLGLGFNLAIRDMEIRGAGNLLGKEQSGSVLSVGFELYSKILKEAVLHLKGEDQLLEETIDPEVKLGVIAFIPEEYIPDISERLVLYQRLAGVHDDHEIDELAEEIHDRFGNYGAEVRHLLELMRLRRLLRHVGVERLEVTTVKFILSFHPKAPIDGEKIAKLVQKKSDKYRLSKNFTLTVRHDLTEPEDPVKAREFLAELLPQITSQKNSDLTVQQ